MIVWTGYGFLAPLITVLIAASIQISLDSMFGKGYFGAHGWPQFMAMILASAMLWFVGCKLNNPAKNQTLVDPNTNEDVILKPSNSCMWVPVQYWGVLLMIITFLMIRDVPFI